MIYFAADFGLDLHYSKLLNMIIENKGNDESLILGILEYLSMNFKFIYIDEIFNVLTYVRDSKNYYQNEQLLSSIILCKISNDSNYLNFVRELIVFDEGNKEFFNNVLKRNVFDEKFFHNSELIELISSK